MNVIEKLRKSGNRVRITHYREFYELDELRRPIIVQKARFQVPKSFMQFALPKGGSTVIELVTPNNEVIEGVALCSEKEAFCKREGVRQALDNLLVKMLKTEKK